MLKKLKIITWISWSLVSSYKLSGTGKKMTNMVYNYQQVRLMPARCEKQASPNRVWESRKRTSGLWYFGLEGITHVSTSIFADLITASWTGAPGTRSRDNWGDGHETEGSRLREPARSTLTSQGGFLPTHGHFLSCLKGGVQLGTSLKEWLYD